MVIWSCSLNKGQKMDFEVDGGVLADRKRVLVDILPRTVLIDSVLVLSFAVLIGLSAQVVIHLGFTPVPITGQTFALLLGAASLGTRRALAGSGLYVLAGMLGVPWFAGWTGGMKITASPTFGYLVGFFIAATVVGYCAERGWGKSFSSMALLMVIGNVVIYAVGASWLGISSGLSVTRAIELGILPFLIGDAVKIVLASILLPTAWKVIGMLHQP